MKKYLRELPPVHELQKDERFNSILDEISLEKSRLTKVLQEEINLIREQLLQNKLQIDEDNKPNFTELIFENTERRVTNLKEGYLKQVINGTGTILHTNLGRARLSDKAVEHVIDAARHYSNLEYKLAEGKRGSRHDIIEELLTEVTGAEAAMVVNNNAAAVYLVLRALAKEKEVIVSRGQLVEIGGSFRVSSIMEESGAHLIEVGTTNKTHLYDYENAINEQTAMMMKVHTSNFKTIGFTKSVETEELVALKDHHPHLIFYEDLGSGSLYDFKSAGIGDEPVVKEVIDAGVDVVSFSGDKLLGGPQAGIIAGKKEIIAKLKKHQLARVLRVDKMTFAALESTLKMYLLGEEALKELPTVRDIIEPLEEIKERAEAFLKELTQQTSSFQAELINEISQIGGGTMPDVELPTFAVAVTNEHLSSHELSERLRKGTPAIVTRIKENKVIIDFRTITKQELSELIAGFKEVTRG
ncbi:L-seryl-tRNA(Sec) selenium transferase [Bacillus taeanensis]|uniref:L-seryl-tRNA(Sec) selenium transferase n=1 Tax=Bacillus taeanensis TaxID=273032 RepID=A0A366XVA5_9BACI|nr:L-seryl-tRNA(Sec) selenium transferase [Bacillus taeanensis]RBW69586.1 L-seryl-tRNA(Sec) selenium transferase [Bacillus taeanensis]